MNRAFGAKLGWNLFNGGEGLWTEVLNKKYMWRSEYSLMNVQLSDSNLWKFICRQKYILLKTVCNGRSGILDQ